MSAHTAALRLFTPYDLRTCLEESLTGMLGDDPDVLKDVQDICSRIDVNVLVDVAVTETATIFTEEEIECLIGFYESQIGARVLRKLPQFNATLAPAIVHALEAMDL